MTDRTEGRLEGLTAAREIYDAWDGNDTEIFEDALDAAIAQAREIPLPLEDHKWHDPECGVNGCQSLVWKGRYDSAVKGRSDFRDAYSGARNDRDYLVTALKAAVSIASEAAREWDAAPSGMKAGKLLLALCGHLRGYRPDIEAIHAVIAKFEISEDGPLGPLANNSVAAEG